MAISDGIVNTNNLVHKYNTNHYKYITIFNYFCTMRIAITGSTGFLGSHLTNHLSKKHEVTPLRRRVFIIGEQDVLIHCAWGGVGADKRNDASSQLANLDHAVWVFESARQAGVKKIISLGSQAELGLFSGRVNEQQSGIPTSAYGHAKQAVLSLLRLYCEANNIKWYWLRLFSLYGKGEGENWLIPSVIRGCKEGKMDLTGCEQQYDYLYVNDFCEAVERAVEVDADSGIYNLTSNESVPLKDIILKIKERINSDAKLNFGALPYRENQVMCMEGDSTKFYSAFDFKPKTTILENIQNIL